MAFSAELVHDYVNRALEKGKVFVAELDRHPPPDGRESWEGFTMNTICKAWRLDAAGVITATVDLGTALDDCDSLFHAITDAIQHADSSGDDEGTSCELRFPQRLSALKKRIVETVRIAGRRPHGRPDT